MFLAQRWYILGLYVYHFWMAAMTPLRRISGNQYLHQSEQDRWCG